MPYNPEFIRPKSADEIKKLRWEVRRGKLNRLKTPRGRDIFFEKHPNENINDLIRKKAIDAVKNMGEKKA